MNSRSAHTALASRPIDSFADRLSSGSRHSGRGWRIHVARDIPRVHIPRAQIVSVLRRIGRSVATHGDITVIVTDDTTMRSLNRRYRGKNRPTDVLAFPLTNETRGASGRSVEGEVYCNHDHARRWRQAEGGTLAAELTRLAVHGCLHLLGYDHHTESDARTMKMAEDRFLSANGLIGKRNGTGRHDA